MDNNVEIGRKLLFNNAQISYYISGNKGKEAILFLHPAFADHRIFETQENYFKDHYQVILIDMPGHGGSRIHGSKVTLRDMPEIIKHILEENRVTVCHVVGVSLGSLVAQAFADRYRNWVQSVTIVGGYSIHKENEHILKTQRKEGLKWILYILFSMNKFRNYVTSVSCSSDRGREVFTNGIQQFRRSSFPAMAGINDFFSRKENPMPYRMLIVYGEHDLKLIKDAAHALHELEIHSQLELIPGAGHCANIDAPNEFNTILENFLSNI